jgi:hypothetical protein
MAPIEPVDLVESTLMIRALRAVLLQTVSRQHELEQLVTQVSGGGRRGELVVNMWPAELWTPEGF